MEQELFSDLFEFKKKSKIKAGEGLPQKKGRYPFYTSSNILSKSVDVCLFEEPSLIFGTGGKPSIHYNQGGFSVSTDCLTAQAKDLKKVCPQYVYHYLAGNLHLLEEGFKGAGLKHISKGYISKISIPLPSLKIQNKIATVLNQTEKLLQLNYDLIIKYDELIQSLYMKMFIKNPSRKEWPQRKIKSLAKGHKESMRTGPFGSDLLHSEFVDEGIAVLGIDNVVENKFSWKQRRYITKEKFEKLKRYQVHPEEVLISIMGTVGRTAVVPDNIGIAINTKHLAAINLKEDLADPYFVSHSIRCNPFILEQIKRKSKGAIMDGLNLTVIKNIEILLPPKKLQLNFRKYYFEIQEQKEVVVNTIQKTEELYQSLLQKAFKGELMQEENYETA